MRLDSLLPLLMSLFQLKYYFFFGHITAREKMSQQIFDVCAGQERIGIFMINSFRKHKQHRHHYQRHVMVPGTPLSQ
ncbi:MAG: hypothetical protein JRI56_06570 [Deltaproteobacteria bacterium]|nr:hypothetical protein [Deltaproteobacteria bacterium]